MPLFERKSGAKFCKAFNGMVPGVQKPQVPLGFKRFDPNGVNAIYDQGSGKKPTEASQRMRIVSQRPTEASQKLQRGVTEHPKRNHKGRVSDGILFVFFQLEGSTS